MERKTKIRAEEGKQELLITREFDLSRELLFRAYSEPELVEQWMGTRVLKLDNRNHGSYRFETTDPRGHRHGFHGVIHEFSPPRRIVRTFEMEDTALPAQLEFLEFESLNDNRSLLRMLLVFRSSDDRDRLLRMPFASGLNRAHDRLQEIVRQLN